MVRPVAAMLLAVLASPALGQEAKPLFDREIDWGQMTSAQHTAARREARQRKFDQLLFCADPGNMPLSNSLGEGLQNRIAQAVAAKMGARVSYFWRPFFERGLTRETFDNKECEILIEVPFGYDRILTSMPIYRSTYVFATRTDADFTIDGFDDPDLAQRRVGVFQHSGAREALARHGVKEGLDIHVLSYDADLRPEKQPWTQVQKVVDGALDIAAVWGPFAGWVKAKGAPLTLTPANLMEDQVVLEFDMAFGLRRNDVVLKYALDFALVAAKDEIAAILAEYGVPLVQCAACAVSGDLPAHGTYFENIVETAQERFLTVAPESAQQLDLARATPDQVMSIERVRASLAAGADPNTEFANAAIASDEARLAFLLEQGAAIDAPDRQGTPAIITAARSRDTRLIEFLLDHGAGIETADRAGLTALHYAVLRNHAPSIALLARRGADLAAPGPGGLTPLALALSQDLRWAAMALVDAGAAVDAPFGPEAMTPLMVLATQDEARNRDARVTGGPAIVDLARALIARGADVNAATKDGVTPLMIAAGHDSTDMLALLLTAGADAARHNSAGRTALQIAEISRSARAAQALRVLAQ